MDDTPNLDIPYLQPNQAQKHVTHNEAIRALDALVQISVASRSLSAPPADPDDGSRYVPATGASGDWAGANGEIAAFQDGGWRIYAPKDGWLVWVEDEAALLVRESGGWTDAVSAALNPAAVVGVNATADTTNRLAVKSPASLFDHDGADHRMTLNKAAATDTASVLFQSAYSGRAEIGLAGGDDFDIKVSPDGTAFDTALRVKADTGFVGVGVDTPASRLHVAKTSDARITIDTTQAGTGGGFDIVNSADGQSWRVTGQLARYKIRDHSAGLDKLRIERGAEGRAIFMNTAQLDVSGPLKVESYIVAALPNPAVAGPGAIAFASDEAGGATLAFSDGTDWRRVQDRGVVS